MASSKVWELLKKPEEISPAPQPKLTTFSFEVVTVDARGNKVDPQTHEAEQFKEMIDDNIALEMVSIPGGTFLMGTEEEEIERLVKKFNREWFRKEKSQHQVTVKPFFIGKYQVTQAQWKAIMGNNPSDFKADIQQVYVEKNNFKTPG